jgi:pimeloyl-ACP methyl ester carboxylesterase
VLGAFSFVLSLECAYIRHAPRVALWGFEEFLLRNTIAVVGLFTVLAWNALLPERRDSLVLGPLPIRLRTILLAKSVAIGTALGAAVVALNAFTGLAYPFVIAPDTFSGVALSMGAYWTVTLAAGLFIFCALLAAQGVAAQLLSYRVFLRVSAAMQLGALVLILGSYFVAPPLASPARLNAPESQRWLLVLPSYWFLGLFERWEGSTQTAFTALAARAVRNLAIAAIVASVAYALAWSRNLRRIVEEPDIAPGDRSRPAARLGSFLASKLLARPLDRVIALFTARTIARSRQHRLLLAIFAGIGVPFALASVRSFLMGTYKDRWDTPNPPLAAVGLLLLVVAIGGARAVFSLPLALPANWIFRITAVYRPASYFAAVRTSLYLLIVAPVWIASTIFYFSIWPAVAALEHCILLALMAVLLVEGFFYQFRKIPFTCSYLPGGSELKRKVGIYAASFLIGVSIVASVESWALQRLARVIVAGLVLAFLAIRVHRQNLDYDSSPYNRVQFEELPVTEISPLDLRQDGEWSGDDAWVESIDPVFGRTRWQRMRPLVIAAAMLLVTGIVYEQVSEWLDGRKFPQIGRSVDIGGRSLNLYCSGEGSPTVILESDFAAAGISWVYVQREIAKFTRACWYDRAGYGWSDPGPFPNHADSAARDLHKLLAAGRILPPYLLVGDGFGTFLSRVYRGYYPEEVSGMVLVEPLNEDTTVSIHNHIEALRPAMVALFGVLGFSGWSRLTADPPGPPPSSLTPREWEEARVMVRQPKTMMARVKEPPIWISGELARAAHGCGDLPLVVLSSGIPTPDWYSETYELRLARNLSLARQSVRGRQMIVPDSQDRIVYEAPDAIVATVRSITEGSRKVMNR